MLDYMHPLFSCELLVFRGYAGMADSITTNEYNYIARLLLNANTVDASVFQKKMPTKPGFDFIKIFRIVLHNYAFLMLVSRLRHTIQWWVNAESLFIYLLRGLKVASKNAVFENTGIRLQYAVPTMLVFFKL